MYETVYFCVCLFFFFKHPTPKKKKDKIVQDVKLCNEENQILKVHRYKEPIVSFNILNLTFPLNLLIKTCSSQISIKFVKFQNL